MGKGGGDSVTVAYRYFVSIHKALCHGPIDKVTKIQVDEKLAWVGDGKNGSHYIDNYYLFGGESREGGIVGAFDVDVGDPDQLPNKFLQGFLGQSIPAFRGVACIMLKDMYMGINPYLKKWWYRTQRIHKRSGNRPQWEDTLSEINVYGAIVKPTDEEWEYVLIPQTEDLLPPMPTEGWQQTVSPLSGNPSGSQNWQPYNTIWAKKTIQLDPFRPIIIAGQVENGAHFFINGVHLFSINGENEDIKEREFFVKYIDTRQFPKGSNELQVCGLDEFPPIPNSSTYLDFSVNVADSGAMNPAHIIRECLTDVEWGMGYPEADMDDTAFKKAAIQLFNEGLGMCVLWDQQQELQDFIGDILRHIDGSLYIDRKSGKFVLKLARDDWKEDLNSILHLDENSVESVTNFKRPTFGELVNTVTVNYWDMALGADRSVTVTDIALAGQGGANAASIDFKGFPTADIANRIAQRELSQLSTPLYTCTVLATTKADVLNIGDVFTLSWGDYGLDRVRFRVSGIAYGDGKTSKVRIECVEDNFESPVFSSTADQYPDWDDPVKPPKPVLNWKAFETPYYHLVKLNGQDIADIILTNDNALGLLSTIVKQSDNAQRADVFVDNFDGKGFNKEFVSNFGTSFTLMTNISKFETKVKVSSLINISQDSILSYGYINDEVIQITEINAELSEVTITRGCLDTVIKGHAKGSVYIDLSENKNSSSKTYSDGDSVKVKQIAVGFSGSAEVPLDEKIVSFNSRAARPYPPAKLSVNGNFYPDKVSSGNLVFEVAHRFKNQQTGEVLLGFFDNSIFKPNSIKYLVECFEIVDGIEGFVNSATFEESCFELNTDLFKFSSNASSGILKVSSIENNLKSFQSYSIVLDLLKPVYDLKSKYNKLEKVSNLIGEYLKDG